jgi:hypothetical protein
VVKKPQASDPAEYADLISSRGQLRRERAQLVFRGLWEGTVDDKGWKNKVSLLSDIVKESNEKASWVEEFIRIAKSVDPGLELERTLILSSMMRETLKEGTDDNSIAKLDAFEGVIHHSRSRKDLFKRIAEASERSLTGLRELSGGPGAEQQEQPPTPKEELPQDQISLEQAINGLRELGAGEETLQRAEAEILYRHKPLWNVPREKQLPELRGMTALEHLRAVWAEEIKHWGHRVYIRTVRMRDPVVIDRASQYMNNRRRRDQDSGAAAGLTFVKGFAPLQTKARRPVRAKPHQTGRAGLTK